MKTILNHWFTSRDGESYSMVKLLAVSAMAVLLYRFALSDSNDFQGFGIAVSTIIAAMAAKYHVERKGGDK